MQALGLIETRGLLPAIECADIMLKTAQVELVERTFVGGGLVTIVVTGDVGAVKAAVEAGAAAVEKIGHLSLVSQHVIPRPHHDIESMVVVSKNPVSACPIPESQQQDDLSFPPVIDSVMHIDNSLPNQDIEAESKLKELIETTEVSTNSEQIITMQSTKEEVDAFIQKFGLEKAVDALISLSVIKLRNLSREYKELDLTGRAISKANKDLLIQKLKGYYERGNKK